MSDEKTQDNMITPDAPRKWIFTVEDFDECIDYLGSDGESLNEIEARRAPFIGTFSESNTEAERRADRWEERNDAFPAETKSYSLGRA